MERPAPDRAVLPPGAADPGPMLRLEAVTKRFPNGRVAVDELSLDVADGQLCVLVGPSGCGKTTTMKLINRLVEPTAGRILLGGEDVVRMPVVQLRRRIGYVIQQVGLFPHQTVATNVATVPRLLGWDKARVRARVAELLELVGLPPSDYGNRYPSQLSGGQRQRVGVARALAGDPQVLLMDEPFGAIDPVTRSRLQDEFLRLQRTLRKTVVFVTHDVDEAVKMGDRIAVLQQGGKLAQYDTPAALLSNPSSEFVAEFVGTDRGIKLLRVTPIDVSALEPVRPGGQRLAAVRHDATLADALAAVLASRDGAIEVRDGERTLGVLTASSIDAQARAASGAR